MGKSASKVVGVADRGCVEVVQAVAPVGVVGPSSIGVLQFGAVVCCLCWRWRSILNQLPPVWCSSLSLLLALSVHPPSASSSLVQWSVASVGVVVPSSISFLQLGAVVCCFWLRCRPFLHHCHPVWRSSRLLLLALSVHPPESSPIRWLMFPSYALLLLFRFSSVYVKLSGWSSNIFSYCCPLLLLS